MSCQYGILRSKKSIYKLEDPWVFSMFHTWGFFRFRGEGVRSWLSEVSTQNYTKFQPGRCGYCHFLDYDGKIIDDMIFAISSESEVLGVPNSTMVSVMLNWLSALLPEDNSISIENMSDKTSIIALQGPQSSNVIGEVLGSKTPLEDSHVKKLWTQTRHFWMDTGDGIYGRRGG